MPRCFAGLITLFVSSLAAAAEEEGGVCQAVDTAPPAWALPLLEPPPCSVPVYPRGVSLRTFVGHFKGRAPFAFARPLEETRAVRGASTRGALLTPAGSGGGGGGGAAGAMAEGGETEVLLAAANSFSTNKRRATLREYLEDFADGSFPAPSPGWRRRRLTGSPAAAAGAAEGEWGSAGAAEHAGASAHHRADGKGPGDEGRHDGGDDDDTDGPRPRPSGQPQNSGGGGVEGDDPTMLSNTTWYLFGDTLGREWEALLSLYPFPLDSASDDGLAAFGVAGPLSGVSFHTHGAAWAEVLHGKKRWWLAPPVARPNFGPNVHQREWAFGGQPAGAAEGDGAGEGAQRALGGVGGGWGSGLDAAGGGMVVEDEDGWGEVLYDAQLASVEEELRRRVVAPRRQRRGGGREAAAFLFEMDDDNDDAADAVGGSIGVSPAAEPSAAPPIVTAADAVAFLTAGLGPSAGFGGGSARNVSSGPAGSRGSSRGRVGGGGGGGHALARPPTMLRCELGPGYVLYIPPGWWHATLNTGHPHNAFVSTFTKESGL